MTDDDLEQIERLHELKEKGFLSEEEFLAEKARILGGNPKGRPQDRFASQPSFGNAPSVAGEFETYSDAATAPAEFRPDRRTSVAVAALITVALLGGGWVVWHRQNSSTAGGGQSGSDLVDTGTKSSLGSTGAVSATTTAQKTASAQAVGSSTKLTQAQLLQGAFAATIAKQGAGFTARKLLPVTADLYAVIATAKGGEAHADAGRFAVQYARRNGDSFVAASPLREVDAGSNGQAPEWHIRSDLGPTALILVEGGGTWQGCTSSSATLVEIAPSSPTILGSVPISYSFEDEQATTEYNGVVEMGVSGLQVRYTGSINSTIPLGMDRGALHPASKLPETC